MIRGWIAEGRVRPPAPHHLILSIRPTTQHCADFDVQVRPILGLAPENGDGPLDDAARSLEGLYPPGLGLSSAARP